MKEQKKGTWEIISRARDSIKVATKMSRKTKIGKLGGA